jgi:hypothetical protein
MDTMSALDNMSGDQFGGGDAIEPSAIYSPDHTMNGAQGEDNSWTAQVTGIKPNSAPYAMQPQDGSGDADSGDQDSAEMPGNGPAKAGGKFPKTDPYAVVGHVAGQMQKTARP